MSEKDKDYIYVTCGIIRRGEKILIAERGKDQSHPGKWEFPGGKVEPGERAEDCLRRELFEELGIQVQIETPFLVYEYDYNRPDGKKHRFFSFWCIILEGEPCLKVHDSYTWIRVEDLPSFDIIEADKQLVSALLANKRGGEAL